MSEAPEWLVDSAMGNIFSLLDVAASTTTMINATAAQEIRASQKVGVLSLVAKNSCRRQTVSMKIKTVIDWITLRPVLSLPDQEARENNNNCTQQAIMLNW